MRASSASSLWPADCAKAVDTKPAATVIAAGGDGTEAIVINPGGLTHTSVALRDALTAVAIPFIEVHISNVHQRESFRHFSYLSAVALGVIAGLGPAGYRLALMHLLSLRPSQRA